MKFTAATLRSTSDRFKNALDARGLTLPLNARLDLWSQIVLDKNHSAAVRCADDAGFVRAVPLSSKRILEKLKSKNRHVDVVTARDIFTEAIASDIKELCDYMDALRILISPSTGTCLSDLGSGPLGIGLLTRNVPGYSSVSPRIMRDADYADFAWIRASAGLVAETVNRLAGYTDVEALDIEASSIRAAEAESNEQWKRYARENAELLGQVVAGDLVQALPDELEEWASFEFDDIKDIVHDSLSNRMQLESTRGASAFLGVDCSLGEAVIDHMAAQVRSTMRIIADERGSQRSGYDAPMDMLVYTVSFAITTIVR